MPTPTLRSTGQKVLFIPGGKTGIRPLSPDLDTVFLPLRITALKRSHLHTGNAENISKQQPAGFLFKKFFKAVNACLKKGLGYESFWEFRSITALKARVPVSPN